MSASAPAVFLDRDGTLVRDRRHGAEPALMRLLPGVATALLALQDAGYKLVVVSNQSGLARGCFDAAEALAMGRRLAALLAPSGLRLDGYHLAPNHPAGLVVGLDRDGDPRKPSPRMLLAAARRTGIDLARSWMVGDALSDVEAGLRAGARGLLIDVGAIAFERVEDLPAICERSDVALVRNMAHAAGHILLADGHGPEALPVLESMGPDGLAVDPSSAVPAPFAALPVDQLIRAAREPDGRGPGEPSPWPDAARLEAARADALLLAQPAGPEIGAGAATGL